MKNAYRRLACCSSPNADRTFAHSYAFPLFFSLYFVSMTPYFFFLSPFFLFSCDALIHISFFKPLPVLSPASLAQHSSRFRPWLVLKVSVISTIPACTTTVLLFPRRRRVGGCVVYQIFLYFQKKRNSCYLLSDSVNDLGPIARRK